MPDQNEVDAKRAYPIASQIGTSGLRATSGFVREEYLRELQGFRGREIYNEMASNDATVAAITFAITMMLRSAKWSVEPTDGEDERAVEAAALVEGMLFRDMSHTFPEFIDRACGMFTYGFAVLEVLWKKRNGPNPEKPWLASEFDDGLWGIRALPSRSQRTIDRWVFDDDENLIGFVQQPTTGPQVTVPISRCLHFRTTAELDNPEGRSVIRSAYRPYYFLKRLQEIEGIGTERDLAGYPILRVPSELLNGNANPAANAARAGYEQFLRNVRRDVQEGVLLPSDRDENGNLFYDFELLSSGGSRQLRIDESITRYQKDIARSVLADFLFLGADGGGSLALGKSKVQTFVLAIKAYLQHLAAQVNEVLIPMIWRLNGLDPEIRPSLQPGEMDQVDLDGIANFIKAMATVGYDLSTDIDLENFLRGKADFPEAPDREGEDFNDPFTPGGPPPPSEEDNPDEQTPDEEEQEEEVAAKQASDWLAKVMEGFNAR